MKRSHCFLLIIGIALLPGCVYPVPVSSECSRTISACLQQCNNDTPRDGGQPTGDNRILTDYRSPCEESCHSICH